ncbi:hypothetical protein ACFVQ3_16780 [Oerskovia sp. NPDC057915]|uniref:hypothetical protein n=1 Tax=Oerskovia sp. NPDC057915 TaxID=3346280 RepID=UPI0036D8B3A2
MITRPVPLRSRLLVGLVLAGALPLAACQEAGVASGADGSPLEEYRALALGTRQEQEELSAAQATAYEDVVARCMTDAGFDYSRQDRSPVPETEAEDETVERPGTREYRARHGYGITGAVLGSPTEEPPSDDTAGEDVGEYPSGLSEEGRRAYDLQLYGESVADDSGTFQNVGGCHNEAWDSVYGAAVRPGEEWDQLLADMEAVHDQAMTSQDAVAVADDWSRCMAEYDFAGLADPTTAEQAVRALVEDAVVPDETGLMIADTVRLGEVEQIEVRLALLDLDCQEKVEFVERREAVLWSYERDFVDDRQKELEAWALAEAERRG